ncbi:MAG: hypothetical protein U0800_20705 [Isosphaeraceae bacterium]
MNPDDPLDDAAYYHDPSPDGGEPESLLDELRSMGRRPYLPMLDDGPPPEPPRGLASRTIALVEAERQPETLPFRSRILKWLPIPETVPMRWADVAVAAGIFLAGTLAWIPANHRQLMQASQLVCLSNLQQLGTALNRYATAHDSYPYPDPDGPLGFNGGFVPILNDDHMLEPDRAALLHCPCAVKAQAHGHATRLPNTEELVALREQSFERFRQALQTDYAYHRGFQAPGASPRPVPSRLIAAVMPLLADQPPYDASGRILRGNSPNHGGGGQNVLYTDGHASWRRNRFLHGQDRDIFLNENGRPAPGIHDYDSCLGPSLFPLIGP